MIWWALVFQHIEFASTLVMFRLFIFLNVIRAGDIQLYTLFVLEKSEGQAYIANLMYVHGYRPALWTLRNVGWMAPWIVSSFTLFFRASQLSTEAYIGKDLTEVNQVYQSIFDIKDKDWTDVIAHHKMTDFCVKHTDRGFFSSSDNTYNCQDRWRHMSMDEKLEWGRKGDAKGTTGWNLFMEQCQGN